MKHALVWFRRDLRLADNPALARAVECCERLTPVYVHAQDEAGVWEAGGASRWWLHHSLKALARSLSEAGSTLIVRQGASLESLQSLIEETGATDVFWNRLYEPAAIARDSHIKAALREQGIQAESFNAALLHEPWESTGPAGKPYRVFTPFWKARVRAGLQLAEHPMATDLPPVDGSIQSACIDELELLPRIPWDQGLAAFWDPGERAARMRLGEFLDSVVLNYADGRDRPDQMDTSMLSPHLHFGEVSPRTIVRHVENVLAARSEPGLTGNAETFLKEVGWREFAYHLLYHFPHTPTQPLREKFEAFPWARNFDAELKAWQRGQTGIPLVDAGMRQLWHTGWMHNRVRMIVASFLTKNLLVPWQHGAKWFWDTLVDADLASNTMGWQWTAGSGADAAPYFRIFSPVLQAQKFDPNGAYIRKWVPEIAALPDKYIGQPWAAPEGMLSEQGMVRGKHYPNPVVDLKASRVRALERYKSIKLPESEV